MLQYHQVHVNRPRLPLRGFYHRDMYLNRIALGRLAVLAGLCLLTSCTARGPTSEHPSAPPPGSPLVAALQDQQSALNMVLNLPDVKAWFMYYSKHTAPPYQAPIVMVDHRENNDILVHVYEQLQNGQTVTFGWYRVNLENNAILKEKR